MADDDNDKKGPGALGYAGAAVAGVAAGGGMGALLHKDALGGSALKAGEELNKIAKEYPEFIKKYPEFQKAESEYRTENPRPEDAGKSEWLKTEDGKKWEEGLKKAQATAETDYVKANAIPTGVVKEGWLKTEDGKKWEEGLKKAQTAAEAGYTEAHPLPEHELHKEWLNTEAGKKWEEGLKAKTDAIDKHKGAFDEWKAQNTKDIQLESKLKEITKVLEADENVIKRSWTAIKHGSGGIKTAVGTAAALAALGTVELASHMRKGSHTEKLEAQRASTQAADAGRTA